MKKYIIFILSLFIISIIYSGVSEAYYRDQSWECTKSGEKSYGDFYGRYGQSYDSQGICKKTCCILCVAQSPIRNCFGGGDSRPLCSCSQGSSTDLTAPVLTVNSPSENNVYDKRAVEFKISSSERVKIEYLDNNQANKGYKLLCRDCLSFNRKLNFKEGDSDITIRATDNSGNQATKIIKFKVDSKAPRISKTYPKNNKYGNGDFTIEYTEENVQSINFVYRESTSTQYNLVSQNCESGAKKTCILNVPNLQNGDIYYSFEVKDIANRKATSKENKVTIDTIDPEVTIDSSLISNTASYRKKLPLSLRVSEKVDLYYKDLNGNNRFTSLCKNCDSYNRNVNFREGDHNLIIKAVDKAENADEENLAFTITN